MALQLQIETITSCNAKCVFCTYPTMKRKKGRMGAAVFSKILNDAQDFKPTIDRISLQGLGEPLMDKDIVSRVRQAREAFPSAEISLFTNGTYLTPEMSSKLAAAGLTLLVVSLTGVSRSSRRVAMGLDDFEMVSDQAAVAASLIPVTKVKMVYARDLVQPGDDQDFIKIWGDNAMVTYEGNWAGDSYKFRGDPHTKPCHRAIDQIMVLWNGDLTLCCFDGEGVHNFGNVMDKPLKELWEDAERQKIKRLHETGRRAENAMCRGCTGI